MREKLKTQIILRRNFAVIFVSILVGAHGLYILAVTLLDQISSHHGSKLTAVVVDVPLLIGISLLYLSSLLRRRKQTAWQVTVMAYVFYLGLGVAAILSSIEDHQLSFIELTRRLLLPTAILVILYIFRAEFIVKSDIRSFRYAARFSTVILLAAFIYGIAGFLLLDKSDFHQEVTFKGAVYSTIDQFDLSSDRLHPYTKRAHIFADSLSFVSVAAVMYVAISLFQPLKMRLQSEETDRDKIIALLNGYKAPSEEFFKIWPHDKHYYFDKSGQSGLAYHVYRGVALCVSDPAGDQKRFADVLTDFGNFCFYNDWLPALVHISSTYKSLYEKQGFSLQKLGQEAVLDLNHFQTNVAKKKYFRQIRNKFTKQGYTSEVISPPHHSAVLQRLNDISQDWLSQPARAERGFVMGYYTEEYMQKCQIIIVRDAAGTIQAFSNLVPSEFDKEEATYDLLRQGSKSLGNINDFLLMELIAYLEFKHYKRLNLGFCPLVGLEGIEKDKRTLIDNVLRFAYANGDRFYSFNGLHRFKNKYEPVWHDKYLGYQNGLRGFSRTINAVIRAMKVKTN